MTEYRFRRPEAAAPLWVVCIHAPRLSSLTGAARAEMATANGAQVVLVPMLPGAAGGYSGRFFFATCVAAEFFVSRVMGREDFGAIGSITLLETVTASVP